MSASRLALSSFVTMSACVTSVPPATKAAELERLECGSTPGEGNTLRLLERCAVLGAEPVYSHIITGRNGSEERVAGAKLLVRPPEGVSIEQMTRVLQCHGARSLLGRIDPNELPDDPFWLPNTWVAISVAAEKGNYVVTLEANDVSSNLRLAARAEAFAVSHPLRPGADPL